MTFLIFGMRAAARLPSTHVQDTFGTGGETGRRLPR